LNILNIIRLKIFETLQFPGGGKDNSKKRYEVSHKGKEGASADGDNKWYQYLRSGVIEGSGRWRLLCGSDDRYGCGGCGVTLSRNGKRSGDVEQLVGQARAGSDWLKVKVAGVNDVGEQITGHALHLFTIARKSSCVYVERRFYFDCTRPTDEFFPLFVGPSTIIFQRRVAVKRICFSFPRKAFSGFAASFLLLSREESSAAQSEPIAFLLGTCGSSGAEGRAREAYFSGQSEPPRRTAQVMLFMFLVV
jgi:hypothetical protein